MVVVKEKSGSTAISAPWDRHAASLAKKPQPIKMYSNMIFSQQGQTCSVDRNKAAWWRPLKVLLNGEIMCDNETTHYL